MPDLTLFFDNDINLSAQVGDILYYSSITSNSEFNIGDSVKRIGEVKSINLEANGDYKIVCDTSLQLNSYPNATTDFIFFAKNNVVNSSSVKGYYSKVKFSTNNPLKSEIHSIGLEVSESSK